MRKLERIETDKPLCDLVLPTLVDVSECEDDVVLRFSFDVGNGEGATLAISQLQALAKPCDCGACVKPKVCRFCFSDGCYDSLLFINGRFLFYGSFVCFLFMQRPL